MYGTNKNQLVAELRDVSVFYKSRGWVFRALNLRVHEGDRIAIVGPSGSGKSTILALLGGGLAAFDGSVRRPKQQEVRIIHQTNPVILRRSVVDNVAIGVLPIQGGKKARQLARLELAKVGLAGRELDISKNLSGGELQRLCVARALVSSPKLLLADEPTGQLDEENSMLVADLMLQVDSSTAVVVATHDMSVAQKFPTVLSAPF